MAPGTASPPRPGVSPPGRSPEVARGSGKSLSHVPSPPALAADICAEMWVLRNPGYPQLFPAHGMLGGRTHGSARTPPAIAPSAVALGGFEEATGCRGPQ